MVNGLYSPEILELIKDRQTLIRKYPHLTVLHYQIHQIEELNDLDPLQKALEINLLLVAHLNPETYPEVDQYIKKYKGQYFLSLERPVQIKALYPSLPSSSKKAIG